MTHLPVSLYPSNAERPLHYSEKVLPIVHCLGKDSYLVVKRQLSMENMMLYLGQWQKQRKVGMCLQRTGLEGGCDVWEAGVELPLGICFIPWYRQLKLLKWKVMPKYPEGL